jgi:hypothetical protein
MPNRHKLFLKQAPMIALTIVFFASLAACAGPKEDIRTAFLHELAASDKGGRYTALLESQQQAFQAYPVDDPALSQALAAAKEDYYAPFQPMTDAHMFETLQQNSFPVYVDKIAGDAGVVAEPGKVTYEKLSESDGKTFYAYEMKLVLTKGSDRRDIVVAGQIATIKAEGDLKVAAFRFDDGGIFAKAVAELGG